MIKCELLTGEQLYVSLMEHFDKYEIQRVDLADVQLSTNEADFTVEGARRSIAIYHLWSDGVVDAWFGKADSDSGGLALQGHTKRGDEQLKQLLMLHKRFTQSGRRKVLRRFERR